jgi:hypothetical protein
MLFHICKAHYIYSYFQSCILTELILGDRLRRPYYLSGVDRVRKIRDRKQRTDIGKYSFANSAIKNWNHLLTETLGTFPCKPKIFINRVRKVIINGVK